MSSGVSSASIIQPAALYPGSKTEKKTQIKLFHYLIEITHYPNGHFEICFIMNAACF